MRKPMLCALILLGVNLIAAEPESHGTWAATLGTGATAFAGTWDAAPGPAGDTVAGNWSLRDPNGVELASGTWAAGRQGKLWKGTWQARRSSGQVYDGSWQAQTDLPAKAHFSDLFKAALAKAVSGNWSMSRYSGAWTIRAFDQK